MSYLFDKNFAMMKCKTWEERMAMEKMFSAVEQMIYELVPQYVEKYLNEHKEKLVLDIETLINGKMINSSNITDAIKEAIAKELNH